MARVSILTPTLVPADAVSNDVLGMHEVLARRGHEVHLFAEDWNVDGFKVNHVWKAPDACDRLDDILIYHHSIGWKAGSDVLQNCAAQTVIKYHNVTPPEFFAEISPQHQRLCEVGRAQLTAIARGDHTAYLAASEYNRRELLREGADESRSFVVPPFNQVGSLSTVVPDMEIIDRYADGRINLLMVGSLRPNKGHIALIEAFAQYYYDYNCNSRLFIVGAEDESLKAYSKSLRHFAEMLHVEEAIVFTGEVPVEALKSYYLSANVFVIASEHEGFCVPLVEAMAMKLPIVGYASAAVAETVGDCGIIWTDRDPALIAESINLLTEDARVSASVSLSAQCRYEDMFANPIIEDQFLRATAAAGIHL